MATQRGLVVDTGVRILDVDDGKNPDSPTGRLSRQINFRFRDGNLRRLWGVFLLFSIGLICIYLTMPAAEYEMLKLPRTLADLRLVKDHLANYAGEYPTKFYLVYCSTYIFMQTFMIPGTN